MSCGPHHGGGRRARQRRRRRRRRHEKTGNDDLKKAPKFETVVRPREQQMRVKMPLLDLPGPILHQDPVGHSVPFLTVPVMVPRDMRSNATYQPYSEKNSMVRTSPFVVWVRYQ